MSDVEAGMEPEVRVNVSTISDSLEPVAYLSEDKETLTGGVEEDSKLV